MQEHSRRELFFFLVRLFFLHLTAALLLLSSWNIVRSWDYVFNVFIFVLRFLVVKEASLPAAFAIFARGYMPRKIVPL